MTISKSIRAFTTLVVLAMGPGANAQEQIVPDAIVGIDHIVLAVNDLEAATATYRALGFAIKPGAVQVNGIRTNLIRFRDGSGIELTTAPEAVDAQTETYRQMLAEAEGPIFFAMFARDTASLIAALGAAKVQFAERAGLVQPRSKAFNFLFFDRDNRSPTDRPEHFAHGNGATAMVRIWLTPDSAIDLQELLVALGGEATNRTVYTPDKARAKVVAVNNGEVVVLPKSHQVTKNRPVAGATFSVRSITALESRLSAAKIVFTRGGVGKRSLVVAPTETHGMWLEFRE